MNRSTIRHSILIFFLITVISYSIFSLLLFNIVTDCSYTEYNKAFDTLKTMEFKLNISADTENWDIRTLVVIKNQLIYVNKNILIHDNGALVLINSVLKINASFPGDLGIKVFNGGNLTVIGSVITAYNTSHHYYIEVNNGSELYVKNSEISYAGVYGSAIPQVLEQYPNGLCTHDSIFTSEFPRTALFVEESNVTIINSIFQNIINDIFFYKLKNCKLINSTISGSGGVFLSNSNYSIIADNTLIDMGIMLMYSSNYNNVTNNTLIGGGIYILNSLNNSIVQNAIHRYQSTGIYIEPSGRNIIRDNQLFGCGFFINGKKQALTQLLIEGNTINHKPLIFILNESNQKYSLENTVGQVIVIYSYNITIQNTYVSNTSEAYLIINSTDLRIVNSTSTINGIGIRFWMCSNCVIWGNSIANNKWGIFLMKTDNITISENVIHNNSYGIHIIDSNNTVIIENIIQGNRYGIYSWNSLNNTIENNTFKDNMVNIKDNLLRGPLIDAYTLVMIMVVISAATAVSIVVAKKLRGTNAEQKYKKISQRKPTGSDEEKGLT